MVYLALSHEAQVAIDTAPLERLMCCCLEATADSQSEEPARFFAATAARIAGVRATRSDLGKEKGCQSELPFHSYIVSEPDMTSAVKPTWTTSADALLNHDTARSALNIFSVLKPIMEAALTTTVIAAAKATKVPSQEELLRLLAAELLNQAGCVVKPPPAGANAVCVDAELQASLPWASSSCW